ncbi:C39 family peptidase [Fictibacillus gelatini]|uniref:C39 family peptidase n=1 Tax=Fictibacillus gelatini TaxID=225985 RepID=UPI00041EF975|nr:C39 family peptidase [Fictibacillus gelatini]
MKKLRLIVIVFVVMFAFLVEAGIGQAKVTKIKKTLYISVSGGNIRTGPGTKYKRIETLKFGTKLNAYEQTTGTDHKTWYHVTYGKNKSGWASSIIVTMKNPVKRVLISAPLISQMPELPRGCEVTSLAMMLQHAGKKVSKMTLAKKVKKDPTPYRVKNGKTYFGNPNTGFVGNMYTFSKPGYGVYHGPVFQLARTYLGNRAVDLSGKDFSTVIQYLDQKTPVWVIANTHFARLSPSYFKTWYTPTGKIKITMKEHSVLVTGYDNNYIYFNDPLANVKNRKAAKRNFIAAWEQMGKQAISYKK